MITKNKLRQEMNRKFSIKPERNNATHVKMKIYIISDVEMLQFILHSHSSAFSLQYLIGDGITFQIQKTSYFKFFKYRYTDWNVLIGKNWKAKTILRSFILFVSYKKIYGFL